jgi:DNA recombination protein RmuC
MGREESRNAGKELREEVSGSLRTMSDTLTNILRQIGRMQQEELKGMTEQLNGFTDSNQDRLDRIRNTLDSRVQTLQESNEKKLSEIRDQVSSGLRVTSNTLAETLENNSKGQQSQLEGMKKQLKDLATSNQDGLDRIRNTLDSRVQTLQESNEKKLDEMRRTVDEKLHDTLERRLGESFQLVSNRLEAVHKGLGEMQNLALGVGDLKRVLTNVKTRGTWAEVQLGAILEQILIPTQYEKNVSVKPNGSERVEYAIRLPGSNDDPESCVWLPIDSKFPQEDYLRLQDATERGDAEGSQLAIDALARTIRSSAKDICDKYISPPHTTDFGIMFLATEGLYAEVLRKPALIEDLQQQYRVVVAGPTTLGAILNSLRMGFQTLAIEQQATEVWRVLGGVKTEFGKFGDVLDKLKKQLNTASNTIEETGVRTRAMQRKLRSVEQLPEAEVSAMLALPITDEEGDVVG